ncbi:MAG: hypothetical protein KY447_09395 [Actinobacteria bacterium]|nr:hypothetical protein [Actinomycetota bacterium]
MTTKENTTVPTTEKPVYRRPANVLEHFIGCPARPERVETINGSRPRQVNIAGATIVEHEPTTTVRCIECGAQVVKAG